MRKWKFGCLLNKEQIVKNKSKDESGITLVELLAVLALMSVVILLGGAVHMFGQKQFQAQTESASQNNDLSYAMTMMSTDLRKRKPEEVTVTTNEIQIKKGESFETVYYVENHQLKRHNEVLVEKVSEFNPVKPERETEYIKVNILIEDSSPGITNKDYQTTIYFRYNGGSEY